jgi:histidinol phosphatase-like PHP family hydrolase
VVHPGYPKVEDFSSEIDDSIHGIELRNPTHDDEMDQPAIKKAAKKHNLLLLQNSDAHFLSDIGKYYNDITIEELCARAS